MKKFLTIFAALTATLYAGAVSITVNDAQVKDGDVIEVSHIPSYDASFEVAQYDLQGKVSSTSGTLNVEITRSEVAKLMDPFEEYVYDSFCISECVNGNGELTQTATFTKVGMNNTLHITCPAVPGKEFRYTYKFTDGAESLTMIVSYSGATAIENVCADAVRLGVYTIFGQQLRADNDTEGLTAGMYIVGGKKVLIK